MQGHACVCVCVDNLQESSFQHVGPENGIQIIRLAGKFLHLLTISLAYWLGFKSKACINSLLSPRGGTLSCSAVLGAEIQG